MVVIPLSDENPLRSIRRACATLALIALCVVAFLRRLAGDKVEDAMGRACFLVFCLPFARPEP